MIGLSLGGGGARGVAHIGVLRHFEKIGLKVDCVAGNSAGSIVASLFAFGLPIDEIEKHVRTLKATSMSAMRIGQLGLFDNPSLKTMLENSLGADALIENSKIPLAIHVTDIESGHGVVLQKGSVITAVLASTCVPGVYVPQEIDGRLYIDGGMTENVPIQALHKMGAWIKIGVNLNGQLQYSKPQGISDVIMNAMDIAIDSQTQNQLKEFDVVLSLDLTRYSRTRSDDFEMLLIEGQKTAMEAFASKADLRFLFMKRQIFLWIQKITPVKIPDFIQNLWRKKRK